LMEEVARPFRFVDLACGDASTSIAALKGTLITHYHGVDLAEPALEMARNYLEGVNWEVKLEQADFVGAMRERREPADVVWIGLSLHHLGQVEKLQVLQEIRAVLSPSGLLMTYDPIISDRETAASFLNRAASMVNREWTGLTLEERAAIGEHIRTQDRPETIAAMMSLSNAAGFARMRELFVSPDNFWRMYCFGV